MALQKRKSIIDNACFISGKQVCYLDFTVIALDHLEFTTLGTTLLCVCYKGMNDNDNDNHNV